MKLPSYLHAQLALLACLAPSGSILAQNIPVTGAASAGASTSNVASAGSILWDQPPAGPIVAIVDQAFPDFPDFNTYEVSDVTFSTDVQVTGVCTWFTNLSFDNVFLNVTEATLNIFSSPVPDNSLDDPSQGMVVPVTASIDGPFIKMQADGLDLDLSAGTYWIGLTPNASFVMVGQEFHQQAETLVGLNSHTRNPGGGFGFGTDWVESGPTLGDPPAPYDGSIRVLGIEDTGIGSSYCIAAANSTGAGALISAAGSASIAANDLVLRAEPIAGNQTGIFFYGPSQTQVAFGNGFRCVAGDSLGLFRLPVAASNAAGILELTVDNTAPPEPLGQLTAGATWNFQAWYRDPAAGGSAFNLSDGIAITFAP